MNAHASFMTKMGIVAALVVASVFHAAPGVAVENGNTLAGDYCMQRIFMGPPPATLSGANQLNCTANDIRLSKATSWSPDKCTAGTKFDLTATFKVDVTANARYDAAFFFRLDGDGNARGSGTNAAGKCSVTTLKPGVSPALNLDTDACGDLNAGSYEVTFTIPDVVCQDTNGDGQLNLPNCTAWHSNQGTACTAPGLPWEAKPDTKSKCVCDDGFQVPVKVEKATLSVTKDVKSGTPSTLPEPGGQFEYAITVTNTSQVQTLTIDRICDDKYGTVAYANGPACPSGTLGSIDSTTCDLDPAVVLQPNGVYACDFKASVRGDPQTVTDTVTFYGTDGANNQVDGSDSVSVSITNVAPAAIVTKSLASSDPLVCAELNYRVKVSNTDAGDASIDLTKLEDDKFGDITSVHGNVVLATDCKVPQTIAKGGLYECGFTARVCSASHTDIVTATVSDNEGGSKGVDSNALTVNVSATVPPAP